MHESMLRPDFIEGITAFFEKRTAELPAAGRRTEDTSMTLDYRAIDVDNHYYETDRLASPGTCPRSSSAAACRWLTDGKRTLAVMGERGQPLHPEPDVRPDHRAGLPGSAVPRRDPRGRRPGVADEGRPDGRTIPSTRTAMPG